MVKRGITWERKDGVTLGQIDSKRARKMFDEGKSFYIATESMSPEAAIEITKKDFAEGDSFDRIVNVYLWYKRWQGRGYRCRFYVRL